MQNTEKSYLSSLINSHLVSCIEMAIRSIAPIGGVLVNLTGSALLTIHRAIHTVNVSWSSERPLHSLYSAVSQLVKILVS